MIKKYFLSVAHLLKRFFHRLFLWTKPAYLRHRTTFQKQFDLKLIYTFWGFLFGILVVIALFLIRHYSSIKTIEYHITKKGIERRKLLSIQFLESSLYVYNEAKDQCSTFLKEIEAKGFRNVLFYGAGEVAEIMVYVITNTPDLFINVLAIIDDDEAKIGKKLVNIPIISSTNINKYNYDGILVSSYGHSKTIISKLNNLNIEKTKIIKFFEEDN